MTEPDNNLTPGQDPDAAVLFLAAARERYDAAWNGTWEDYATALELLSSALWSAGDVPRLLGAVQIALKPHASLDVIIYAACSEHNIFATKGDPSRFEKMRECPACIKTVHPTCGACDEDWPCEPYRDIRAELTGKDEHSQGEASESAPRNG